MKIFTQIAVPATLCLLTTRPCTAQISTGSTNPGTATEVALAGSSFTWNTPTGALTAGGTYAGTATLLSVNTGTTDYLQLTNFGFAIPVGSTIDGIQVNLSRQAAGLSLTILGITLTGSVNDNVVQLIGPGVTSVNKASGAAWPNGWGIASYGSSGDGWGPTVWTAAMINSPAFGVQIATNLNGGTLLGIDLIPGAQIDAVSVNVTYSLPVSLALHLDQWSATQQGGVNVLAWQASADGQPGTFVVERSANGQDWTSLVKINAAAGQQQYNYTDEKPFANGTTYYRLRLHSADETDSWSSVQVLTAKRVHPVISMYPNPFHNTINISAPGPFTRVLLTNTQGVTIWVKEFPGGTNGTQIPAASLPQGLYYLTIDGATYSLIKGS